MLNLSYHQTPMTIAISYTPHQESHLLSINGLLLDLDFGEALSL